MFLVYFWKLGVQSGRVVRLYNGPGINSSQFHMLFGTFVSGIRAYLSIMNQSQKIYIEQYKIMEIKIFEIYPMKVRAAHLPKFIHFCTDWLNQTKVGISNLFRPLSAFCWIVSALHLMFELESSFCMRIKYKYKYFIL